MKPVCWHSRRSKACLFFSVAADRRSKAYRGLPEARGQSEAHGDSCGSGSPLRNINRTQSLKGPEMDEIINAIGGHFKHADSLGGPCLRV